MWAQTGVIVSEFVAELAHLRLQAPFIEHQQIAAILKGWALIIV